MLFKEEPIRGEFWLLCMVGVYRFVQLARNISPKSQRTEITTVRIEMMESSILPTGKLPFTGLVPRQESFPS